MRANLTAALLQQTFVATTTDCWSARRRSYLGVTVHWIDDVSLVRRSAALACKRLRGSHTFDVLAEALDTVHADYGIRTKVVKTTTDSGSNFVKAFSVFATDDTSEMSEAAECVQDGVTFEDVDGLLESDDITEYQLPSHHRCACHSLNLVSTTDAQKAEDSAPGYKRVSRAAFAKCRSLWSKTGHSRMRVVSCSCGPTRLDGTPYSWQWRGWCGSRRRRGKMHCAINLTYQSKLL